MAGHADDDLTLLDDLLAKALAAGADAADAVAVHGTSLSHAQRLGEIEKLERAEGSDLGLRALIGRQPLDELGEANSELLS